jgi:hypothetical protein
VMGGFQLMWVPCYRLFGLVYGWLCMACGGGLVLGGTRSDGWRRSGFLRDFLIGLLFEFLLCG